MTVVEDKERERERENERERTVCRRTHTLTKGSEKRPRSSERQRHKLVRHSRSELENPVRTSALQSAQRPSAPTAHRAARRWWQAPHSFRRVAARHGLQLQSLLMIPTAAV